MRGAGSWAEIRRVARERFGGVRLGVQEDDVGLDFVGQAHRVVAVGGDGDDLEPGVLLQLGVQGAGEQALVVHKQDSHGVSSVGGTRHGSASMADLPPGVKPGFR